MLPKALLRTWTLCACLAHTASASSDFDHGHPRLRDSAPTAHYESQAPLQRAPNPAKQVAIIGAGSGGSSTAYFLKRFADEAGIALDLTILEQSNYVGGRSTTICAFANDTTPTEPCVPIEIGASIFVEANQILFEAVKTFNLTLESTQRDGPSEAETLGIFDGQRFIFTQVTDGSRWRIWWGSAKILWRYGVSPIRTLRLMQNTIRTFLQMYAEPVFPWKEGLTAAVTDVGLLDATSVTGSQLLSDNGVSEPFAQEIVQAGTRVNYAQNLTGISGLITMVSIAGDGAMSVEGGNWQMFARMLEASGADVYVNSKVDEIEIGAPDGKIQLSSTAARMSDFGLDALVLASPYHQSEIQFKPLPSHVPADVPYVRLHVTLFSSPHRLSPEFFGMKHGDQVPDVVLTTLPERETGQGLNQTPRFNSISKLRTVINPFTSPTRHEHIYKIFSIDKVSNAFLHELVHQEGSAGAGDTTWTKLSNADQKPVSWIYRKTWLSYPYMVPRVTFEPHKLDENLWYTSGIESFISTMETSALSGKNVARLIVDGWLQENTRESSN